MSEDNKTKPEVDEVPAQPHAEAATEPVVEPTVASLLVKKGE